MNNAQLAPPDLRTWIRPTPTTADAPAHPAPLSPDTRARAAELLRTVRVSGSDPVGPTLDAVADHLEAHGLTLGIASPAVPGTPDAPDRRAYLDALISAVGWGGPLAEFMELPGVANIQVNQANAPVILDYASGGRDTVHGFTLSRAWAEYLVTRWSVSYGRPAPDIHGVVHGRIGRIRFTYFGADHAVHGMTLQLRLPLSRPTLDDLVERGTLTSEAASVLRALVRARMHMLVSGSSNAGKSTLVNALLAEVDPDERVGVVEVFSELDTAGRPGTVAYELGPAANHTDGLAHLLQANLYNSVTRLVLGEARGAEAAHLIAAMTSGTAGCIATIHAPSADAAPRRLAQCARQSPHLAGLTMPELCRIIAELGLIGVHVSLVPGPRGAQRRVTQVIEVYDALDDTFKRHELFRTDASGALRWAEPALSDATWERLQAEKLFLPVYGRTPAKGKPAAGGRRW